MSALLDEIIAARKAKAIEYEEYLKRIAELAKKVQAGTGRGHAGEARHARQARPLQQPRPERGAGAADRRGGQAQCGLTAGAAFRPASRSSSRRSTALLQDVGRGRADLPHHQGAGGILMATRLQLGDIAVDVVFKDIKNVHLSVYPPTGRVRISAPLRMSLDTIRVFAISKLGWIKQQQKKLREQERETPREYLDRESHYVWGKRYLLKVIESERGAVGRIEAQPAWCCRCARAPMRPEARQSSRSGIASRSRAAVPPLIAKWEPLMGVKVARFFVQRMKTQMGELQPAAGTHPTEHRSGQEAAGVPGIHRRPRDGALARPTSQRPVRWLDGPVSPELAAPPAGAQPRPTCPRRLGALNRIAASNRFCLPQRRDFGCVYICWRFGNR